MFKLCKRGTLAIRSIASVYSGIHSSTALNSLNEFQLLKVTKEFDHVYDRNKDGFIDKSDIDSFKKKMRSYRQFVDQRAVQTVYSSGYDDYWYLLNNFADTNKDGKLSREEWIEIWTTVIEETTKKGGQFRNFPQWVQMMPPNIFQVMDAKKDHVIDCDEYTHFWHYVGGFPTITKEAVNHYFDVMTEEGKYKLDLVRVQDLYTDYYLSESPDTPGKYIAGPFQEN